MHQEVVYESQQPSVHNSSSTEFSLTSDQFVYIQLLMPKGYALVEEKKKKDKKEPIPGEMESQSQSVQGVRNSARRPQPKQIVPKWSDTKKFYQQGTTTKTKQIIPVATLSPEEIAYYQDILGQIKKHPSAFPFLKPVDPIQLQIPDYFQVIKHPMDLSTIEKRLKQKFYQSPSQVLHDLNQIWVNSYSYNPKGSDMYAMTTQMEKFTNKLLVKPQQTKEKEPVAPVIIAKKVVPKEMVKPPKKNRQQLKQSAKSMTASQKMQLKMDIEQLPPEYLGGVWEIVSKDRDDIETIVDLNSLQFQKLKKLDAYCKEVVHFRRREERKVMEPVTEYQDIVSVDESSFLLDSD